MKDLKFNTYANSKYELIFWCEDLRGQVKSLKKSWITENNGGKILRLELVTHSNLKGIALNTGEMELACWFSSVLMIPF